MGSVLFGCLIVVFQDQTQEAFSSKICSWRELILRKKWIFYSQAFETDKLPAFST